MSASAVPRPTVSVIFGGQSPEHEVSIRSAARVAAGIEATGQYAPVPIYITPQGRWRWSRPTDALPAEALVRAVEDPDLLRRHYQPGELDFPQALLHLLVDEYATHFIILHGVNGEDGRLQGALELAGLPYTGSGSAASALALDKPRCQAYLAARGLPIPRFVALDRRSAASGDFQAVLERGFSFPYVVKPALGGSSVGVRIARTHAELVEGLHEAWEMGPVVHVEEYVGGREFTCGVLEGSEPQALPVVEIIPPEGRFFDYEAKYVPGLSREIVPAEIEPALEGRLRELAVEVHRAVGVEGFSRVDFICGAAGPKILEINTIPGMTETSLLPQAAAAAGLSFPELVGRIIEHSVRRAGSKPMPEGGARG